MSGGEWGLILTFVLACASAAGMAEDKAQWCRGYIDPEWDANDLLLATISYRDHLNDRLADAERKDYRITATVQEIEARLRIVRIIDSPPDDLRDPRDEVVAALTSPGFRRRAQYEQYLDDLKLLAERLKHGARREMERTLTNVQARLNRAGRLRAARRHRRGGD